MVGRLKPATSRERGRALKFQVPGFIQAPSAAYLPNARGSGATGPNRYWPFPCGGTFRTQWDGSHEPRHLTVEKTSARAWRGRAARRAGRRRGGAARCVGRSGPRRSRGRGGVPHVDDRPARAELAGERGELRVVRPSRVLGVERARVGAADLEEPVSWTSSIRLVCGGVCISTSSSRKVGEAVALVERHRRVVGEKPDRPPAAVLAQQVDHPPVAVAVGRDGRDAREELVERLALGQPGEVDLREQAVDPAGAGEQVPHLGRVRGSRAPPRPRRSRARRARGGSSPRPGCRPRPPASLRGTARGRRR